MAKLEGYLQKYYGRVPQSEAEFLRSIRYLPPDLMKEIPFSDMSFSFLADSCMEYGNPPQICYVQAAYREFVPRLMETYNIAYVGNIVGAVEIME